MYILHFRSISTCPTDCFSILPFSYHLFTIFSILIFFFFSFPAFHALLSFTFSHLFFPFFHFSGGWAALMDLMSSLGIVCSVAIICFSSQEFAEYSFYYKSVIFLLSQQLLLCLKFLIQQSLPGNPQWVSELAARNEYIRYQYSLFGIYLLRSFSSFLFSFPKQAFFSSCSMNSNGVYCLHCNHALELNGLYYNF